MARAGIRSTTALPRRLAMQSNSSTSSTPPTCFRSPTDRRPIPKPARRIHCWGGPRRATLRQRQAVSFGSIGAVQSYSELELALGRATFQRERFEFENSGSNQISVISLSTILSSPALSVVVCVIAAFILEPLLVDALKRSWRGRRPQPG